MSNIDMLVTPIRISTSIIPNKQMTQFNLDHEQDSTPGEKRQKGESERGGRREKAEKQSEGKEHTAVQIIM